MCWGILLVVAVLFSCGASVVADDTVRDPFQATVSAPKAPPRSSVREQVRVNANLEGISIGQKGAFAVISGEVFHEEEEKKGVKVIKIRKKEVDIVMNGVSQTLRSIPLETASAASKRGKWSEGQTVCPPGEKCLL